jgi:GNAT superfamily N-acetyltransferase
MTIKIESTFHLSNQSINLSKYDDLMMTSIYSSIGLDEYENLSLEELDELDAKGEFPEPIIIGRICAHRFDLSFHDEDLCIVADCVSSDLVYFASYFLLEEGNEFRSCNYLFYLNGVFIEPQYRGNNYGLHALALFLQAFAWGETVGCHPVPIKDLKDKYPAHQGKRLMRNYWSKIGLERYSEKHNILWTPAWEMPDWLRTNLLED